MPDKYQLIQIREDTLYILKRGLSRDDVADYPVLRDEEDCDRSNPKSTYAVSDSSMSRIFGR